MKIDKKKVVFFSVITTMVIFIFSYTMFVMSDSESSTELQQPEIPELKEVEKTYTSKIEALEDIKENRERNIPKIYPDKFLDSLDAYSPAIEDTEVEWKFDSLSRFGNLNNSFHDTVIIDGNELGSETGIAKGVALKASDIEDLAVGHTTFFLGAIHTDERMLNSGKAFHAEINGTQTVHTGDRIEIILKEDLVYKEFFFPRNTKLYGFAFLQLNRLNIEISHVANQQLKLKAYDLQDSNEGIYIRNSFKAEAGREVFDDVLEDINIGGLPQLSGIKNIFRKNNRKLKVTVYDQYELLLKTEQ